MEKNYRDAIYIYGSIDDVDRPWPGVSQIFGPVVSQIFDYGRAGANSEAYSLH